MHPVLTPPSLRGTPGRPLQDLRVRPDSDSLPSLILLLPMVRPRLPGRREGLRPYVSSTLPFLSREPRGPLSGRTGKTGVAHRRSTTGLSTSCAYAWLIRSEGRRVGARRGSGVGRRNMGVNPHPSRRVGGAPGCAWNPPLCGWSGSSPGGGQPLDRTVPPLGLTSGFTHLGGFSFYSFSLQR